MPPLSNIQLEKRTIVRLKKAKEYPRQTYNGLILRLLEVFQSRRANQYDEFLHKIQQPKMKELWDNAEDEAWEHA